MKATLKGLLIASGFMSTVSSVHADSLDDLRQCAYYCDYRCNDLAREAEGALFNYRRSCGGGQQPQRLTARLTADGASQILARPGQQVFYEWRATGATRVESYYSALGSASCYVKERSWIANNLAGSYAGVIVPNQVGCTFYFRYRAINDNTNQAVEDTVQVRVVN